MKLSVDRLFGERTEAEQSADDPAAVALEEAKALRNSMPRKGRKLGPLLKEDVERFEDEGGTVVDDNDDEFENRVLEPIKLYEILKVGMTDPLPPVRHPLSQDLHDKKGTDYGTPEDPFANVRGATDFGLPAPMGAFIAMNDCMQRIKSFCKNNKLENESLDNSLRDMAVYSLIGLVLWEEEENENGSK